MNGTKLNPYLFKSVTNIDLPDNIVQKVQNLFSSRRGVAFARLRKSMKKRVNNDQNTIRPTTTNLENEDDDFMPKKKCRRAKKRWRKEDKVIKSIERTLNDITKIEEDKLNQNLLNELKTQKKELEIKVLELEKKSLR